MDISWIDWWTLAGVVVVGLIAAKVNWKLSWKAERAHVLDMASRQLADVIMQAMDKGKEVAEQRHAANRLRTPIDRYVHSTYVPSKPSPDHLIELMKATSEKLRAQGYTVACTIKPPPATRKL
jgi:hypothetical protein